MLNTVCRVSVGSVTYAIKAQKSLAVAAIHSEVVKLDSGNFGKGCTYGLEFGCSQRANVSAVLGNAGIRHRGISDAEGEGSR